MKAVKADKIQGRNRILDLSDNTASKKREQF